MPVVHATHNPQFVRLDITPSWYAITGMRQTMLPFVVIQIMQHELRGIHREIRLHLDGVELEVLNLVDKDVNALGKDLQAKLSALVPG